MGLAKAIDIGAKGMKVVVSFGSGIAITALGVKAKKIVKVISNTHIDKQAKWIKDTFNIH
ncbi:MAG: hypothetical protein K0R00_130 [Herbinix sp.]|jgi:hypothetical protein|nr:hypothetical protein [Herbinix sp.]